MTQASGDLAKYAFWGGAAYILYYFLTKSRASTNPLDQSVAQPILETHSLNGLSAAVSQQGVNPVPVTATPAAPKNNAVIPQHGPQMPEKEPSFAQLQANFNAAKGTGFANELEASRAIQEYKDTHRQGILAQMATSATHRAAAELARRGLIGRPDIFDPFLQVIETDTRFRPSSIRGFRFGPANRPSGTYKSPGGTYTPPRNPYDTTFYDPESGSYRSLEP